METPMTPFLRRSLPAALLLALIFPAAARPQALVRVPRDARDLSQAMVKVANNGVIEIAAGIYVPPPAGFSLTNNRKAFTIRAAAGAQVVLGGQGARRIFRFKNNARAGTRPVTFQGIVFRNAISTTEGDGGAVTLREAEARFENCAFVGNHANPATTGGGAVRVFSHSTATFVGSRFEANSSKNRGGALSVEDGSGVQLTRTTFLRNRVNLAGHRVNAPGGAVYVSDSVLRVDDSLFEENQAAFAGGAVYGIGHWAAPEATPRANLTVTRTTFRNNSVPADPALLPPGQTSGGAIHVEDQATLTLDRSYFAGNQAEFGGAVDAYRAVVDVRGSAFSGNGAPLSGRFAGAGGAILLASVDFADSSTGQGATNRRPGALTVADSLFQGRPEPASSAHQGGCLFAAGDTNRAYGEGGVAASGSVADHRARVSIQRTIFSDCNVQKTASGGGGSGDLTLADSLILASDARGAGAFGGGLSVQLDSLARVARSTFSRNSAQQSGGALQAVGATIEVTGSRFFGNEVNFGATDNLTASRGAAIFSIPMIARRKRDVAGVVATSLFADNRGLPLYEADPAGSGEPVNGLRYDDDQFQTASFGGRVYANTLAAPGGLDPSALNALTVFRCCGRPSTDKSLGGNLRLLQPPTVGALVAVPRAGSSAAGSGPFLGYAWSGFSAALNGVALPFEPKSGVLAELPAATYTLRADGIGVATVAVAP
jgi:predicted outer membrane repeat protein